MDTPEIRSTPLRMKMNTLCRAANLSRSTIYQYLRAGILSPPIKEGPTQVLYNDAHLAQLEKIRYLREHKKLSIAEIQQEFQVETPKKEDTEDTPKTLKNLLITKAVELFSKNGFARTKITDITDSLNLGKGTFYLYFKSKDELFLECIERAPEFILPEHTWDEIRKERDYFRRAHKRILIMLEAFPTFRGIISIAKLALRGDDSNMAIKATESLNTIIKALIKDLNRAIKNGFVREIDRELISFIIFGIGEAAGYWLMMNPDYSPEECADKVADFLSHGLMAPNFRIHEKYDKMSFNVKVEGVSNTTIQLQEIRFNNTAYFEGKLGGGRLEIDKDKVSNIEVKKKGPEYIATVTMKIGEVITMNIDGSIILSGESPFGKYTIPMAKVIKIEMAPVDELKTVLQNDTAE